jgi:hypothetical protein
LKRGANPHLIYDQTNKPVLWVGDNPWALISQLTDADVTTYLNARQQQGFNVLLMGLIEHKFATNAPRNIYGDAPFTGAPFTTPNEAYFAHADRVISAAAQRGIAVLLDPLYLGYACGDEGWCAEVQAASTSAMQQWGQYVGNRYKSFANVVWVVGGDTDPTPVASKVTAFVTGLTQADPTHLVVPYNGRGTMGVGPWSGAAWVTLNNTYTDNYTYPQAKTAYAYSPTLPFFLIESWYENEHGMNPQGLRAEAYWTTLSGGFGFLMGNCPMWGFGSPASAGFCNSGGTWQSWLNSPGAAGMTYMGALFAGRAWQNLVPDWGHTVLTAGYGTWGGTDYVTAARTSDGTLVLAYLPTVRTVTVDMTQLAGPVTARWYDPSNGTYTTISGSPFANIGTQQFTPPGNNAGGAGDWVLVLN